jgi:hypothetical protein
MLMPERFGESPFGLGEEDWRVLTKVRVNVLIVGPKPLTAEIVEAILPGMSPPVAQWRASGDGPPPRPCGTLLLANADELTLDEQRQLDEWLTADASPQIVTTASEPLFPLVEQGRFLARLYYRLNVVYLALEAAG